MRNTKEPDLLAMPPVKPKLSPKTDFDKPYRLAYTGHMQLLFLDTETSDLTPTEGNIIEIAGVVTDLNPANLRLTPIDHFSCLIRLRTTLEPKITRITGLSEADFTQAPTLLQAQINWAKWLETYPDIQGIIGHSIDFDLNFLRYEGWYLPPDPQIIDTLNLSKIFLPYLNAVNLEYLVSTLKLQPTSKQTQQLTPHRALYDTYCSANLFSYLLEKLNKISMPPQFIQTVQHHFLPLNIHFYPNPKTELPQTEDSLNQLNDQPLNLNWQGNPQTPGVSNLLQKATPASLQYTISLINPNLPTESALQLTQLASAIYHKLTNPKWFCKLHVRQASDTILADLILNQTVQIHNPNQKQVNLPTTESLLSHIRYLVENNYQIGSLIQLLEIYTAIDPNQTENIQQTISAYDFLLLSLQPFWVKGEFAYHGRYLQPQEKAIKIRFGQLVTKLNQLQQQDWQTTDPLQTLLVKHIQPYLQNLNLSPERQYTFRIHKDILTLHNPKPDFHLVNHLNQLLQNFPNLQANTYLPKEQYTLFLQQIGLSQILNPEIIPTKFHNQSPALHLVPGSPHLQDILDQGLNQDKPTLILCGQNSGLKDCQRLLTNHFNSKDYLLLGESGSLTKNVSKLLQGFKGIFVSKTGDFYYLSKLPQLPEFHRIYVLAEPYLHLHPYWHNQDPEVAKKLKAYNLQSIAGWIQHHTQNEVYYLRSYSL